MDVFDIGALDAADEAEMVVHSNGKPSTWKWVFAGPGHSAAIAQQNRISREELSKRRQKEQAQANGRKWKAPDQSPEEVLQENVEFVMERLLRWSDVTLNGQPYPYSPENARALLTDRKKGALLQQAIDFLLDDNSFIKPSATS